MKFAAIVYLVLVTTTASYGQDGSDILYAKVNKLDNSYIGDFVHLDFYNRSFGGKIIDTVLVTVDNKPIKFFEHRQDNGFNNWFRGQYLQSVNLDADEYIRIVKSRLDKITADSITVTNYMEYYVKEKPITAKAREISATFPCGIIAEVLVSAESHVSK